MKQLFYWHLIWADGPVAALSDGQLAVDLVTTGEIRYRLLNEADELHDEISQIEAGLIKRCWKRLLDQFPSELEHATEIMLERGVDIRPKNIDLLRMELQTVINSDKPSSNRQLSVVINPRLRMIYSTFGQLEVDPASLALENAVDSISMEACTQIQKLNLLFLATSGTAPLISLEPRELDQTRSVQFQVTEELAAINDSFVLEWNSAIPCFRHRL